MLDITVADAVAIGSLVWGGIALLRGTKAGEHAKHATPPDPPMAMIGGAIVDTNTLRDLTVAVKSLAKAMLETSDRQKSSREEQRWEKLLEQLEKREQRMAEQFGRLFHEQSDRDDERVRSGPPKRR